MLPNGKMIAVKNLVSSSEVQQKQFKNEVDNLMRVRHQNIVQFVGYCYETWLKYTDYNGKHIFAERPKRLLCFEYMPKGSLDRYISDESSGLDWPSRYKIIKGICCGLHYLHEECQTNASVIHLDLKPANILLDDNMEPKIADFGLSKFFDDQKVQTCATTIAGSHGYMAPEYIWDHIITTKADIYSLGVIIIEMITGRRIGPFGITVTSCQDFVEPYQTLCSKQVLGKWRNRFEETPGHASPELECQQIESCLQIGLSCIKIDRMERPTTKEVIEKLHRWESTNCYASNEENSHKDKIVPTPKELLEISPLELRFSLEINKRIPCIVKLTNKTDDYVAFYFGLMMAKKNYYIEPTSGFLWPQSTFNVVVTMEEEQELQLDWQCSDEFLIQSIAVEKYMLTSKPITADLFDNMSSNLVNKVKLTVVYVPPAELPSASHTGSEARFSSLTSSSNLDSIKRLEDFPENLNILTMCISHDLGFINGRPTAAVIIYRCLLHWKSFEAERSLIFHHVIQIMSSWEKEAQDSNDKLPYWLSNLFTLLVLLQQTLKISGAIRSTTQGLIGKMTQGLIGKMFTSTQASAQKGGGPSIEEAKYPVLLFKQRLTAWLEKFYGMIRDNLKTEISPLLGLCIQAPRTARASLIKGAKSQANALAQQTLKAHWQSIVKILTNNLNVLKANYVPSFLIRKLFTQVFSFFNAQLFNSLLLRRECCSFSNGEYVKAGLAELAEWCISGTEKYAGTSWDELKHIRQAVGFLVLHQKPNKTLQEITNDLCPVLSIQQLYRISTMYWDDKYGTHTVSSEVISEMRLRMTEDSENAAVDSFLLDGDTSIPFSVDDLSRSETEFDVTEVQIPPSIVEKCAIASQKPNN
ncbi:myosin-15-like isoform X3 [Miscanthus floridulus]